MQRLDRFARVLAFVLLFSAWTDGSAAEFATPTSDGWQAWQVVGSDSGTNACCYRWGNRSVSKQGCDLDGHNGNSITLGDCELDSSGQVTVYVRIANGKVNKVRALAADCAVTTQTGVNTLGSVPNDASVAWLIKQVDAETRVSRDAIAAISAHAGKEAFSALTRLVEDRDRPKKTREQALFWLAQTESDEAFEYLDAILSKN
jgi:hypothetical protein